MSLALIFAGLALLVLLLSDVFFTVFDPRGRGGPLNRRQNRFLWRLLRNMGARHDGVLAVGAPLMSVVTVISWVALLIVSFALIHYPFVDGFLVSPGSLRAPWVEALYFSGYTAATLGFGDLVPDRPTLRLLAPLQALLGFALVSVSVTYLLAIYRELLAMQTLASFIAVNLKDESGRAGEWAKRGDAAERFAERVHWSLLQALQAHFHYPILYYFRPEERTRSLPVQLVGLLAALDRVSERGDPESRMPFGVLRESLGEYMQLVEAHFVPKDFATDVEREDDAARAGERLLRFMRYSTA